MGGMVTKTASIEMYDSIESNDDERANNIRTLLHDLQNNLQVMSFELELVGLESPAAKLSPKLGPLVEKMKQGLQELRTQVVGAKQITAVVDFSEILSDAWAAVSKVLAANLRVDLHGGSQRWIVTANRVQLFETFETILKIFAQPMLTHGSLEFHTQDRIYGADRFVQLIFKAQSSNVGTGEERSAVVLPAGKAGGLEKELDQLRESVAPWQGRIQVDCDGSHLCRLILEIPGCRVA